MKNVLLTISDDLEDARFVGFANFIGSQTRHSSIIQISFCNVVQTTHRTVGSELGMLDVSLEFN